MENGAGFDHGTEQDVNSACAQHRKGWTINFTNYDLVAANAGKASECIACGQCEVLCPQHLPIIDALKKVAAHYEH